MDRNWKKIEVGMEMPQWLGKPDGQILEWNDVSGFNLQIFFNSPTAQEIKDIGSAGPFEIGFKSIDDIGFFMTKFGNQEWMDCAFSPNLYSSVPDFCIDEDKGYALNIFLIDTAKGQLVKMRTLALDKEFSKHIRTWAEKVLEKDIDRDYYNAVIDKTYAKYPSAADIVSVADIKWSKPL